MDQCLLLSSAFEFHLFNTQATNLKMNITEYCQKLPKIELHAHLNGSLSLSTLRKLSEMQNKNEEETEKALVNFEKCSCLSEFFPAFDLTYTLTNSPESIYMATKDVIKEFCQDNVVYLELRSTPRKVKDLMTKEEYGDAVIRAIKDCEIEHPTIIVKFLVSVNRKQGRETAEENVHLAIRMKDKYPNYVLGIDLSGDPTQGEAFIKLMGEARDAGLKITSHCAEVPNKMEVMDILRFKPDRLGHCTCIHPSLNGSDDQFEKLLESKIPVELCLTSNIKCKTVSAMSKHHFQYLYQAKHPICISTDDKGVFKTTLSKEFELLSQHFDLTKEELKEISRNSVKYTFASDEEKRKLLALFDKFD